MITKPQASYVKNAIFLSHTSLADFLECPRAYYFKNIYRHKRAFLPGEEPHEPFRIQIASPYLSLGSVVHDSVKWFLDIQKQATFGQLEQKFRNLWLKYTGKKGGFSSREEERDFGQRGLKMLENFFKNVYKLENKLHTMDFPKINLLDDVILTGNFDFVGEKEDGTLHVLDFKTGAKDETDPIQLYIYAILAEANFKKPVSSASFWYLDRDDTPKEIVLDPLEPKVEWLQGKAKQVKEVLKKGEWVCIKGEKLCRDCRDYQAILDGKGQFQFSDYRYRKDIYYLKR